MSAEITVPEATLSGSRRRLYSLVEKCLSTALVCAIAIVVAMLFRFGTDRAHDKTIVFHGAHFLVAVCAVLSHEKYGSGRYVCTGAAHRDMQAAGLDYEEATLARIRKTLPELGKDT